MSLYYVAQGRSQVPPTDTPLKRAERFMRWMHPRLSRDYKDLQGHDYECDGLARKIAAMFPEDGTPHVISVAGVSDDIRLVPLRYSGRLSWIFHDIAYDSGIVLDPMVGRPLALEDYFPGAFGIAVDDIYFHDGIYGNSRESGHRFEAYALYPGHPEYAEIF